MKNIFSSQVLILLVVFSLLVSCSSSDIGYREEIPPATNLDTDDVAINLEGELQISDFVWKGLNQYYYWQEEVPALSDDKKNDVKAYAQYINQNPEPEEFFESLKHENDRFSWIQDDYVELENTLQGVYATNGVEFGLLRACQNCNEIVGFVKYILEDSDAEGKNIQRGDLFTGVNGTVLTVDNYRNLLFGEELTYSLNMAEVNDGTLVNNEVVVELTKIENFETNPIQISSIIPYSPGETEYTGNIGYLMYNQFVLDKSDELNAVFGEFKAEGITDLVLDLRYNGGGNVRNCVELASMITGQFNNEIFAQEQWNSKLDAYIREEFGEERLVDRFVGFLSDGEAINSLNLNRVFIITTSESASASELLINGLASYIEVIQVGEQTVGKNVASITLYDYIDNDGTRNPDHTYAMQPIVLKIANNDGFADYYNGLEPNILVEENIRDLGVLGSPDETLFSAVLSVLSGTEKRSSKSSSYSKSLLIKDPLMEQRQRMFVDKEELLLSQSIR